jgi:hypothetical protein
LRNAGICGHKTTINRYNIVNERTKEGADGEGMVKYRCGGILAGSTKDKRQKWLIVVGIQIKAKRFSNDGMIGTKNCPRRLALRVSFGDW